MGFSVTRLALLVSLPVWETSRAPSPFEATRLQNNCPPSPNSAPRGSQELAAKRQGAKISFQQRYPLANQNTASAQPRKLDCLPLAKQMIPASQQGERATLQGPKHLFPSPSTLNLHRSNRWEHSFYSQNTWALCPAPSPSSCATWGKSLNLSETHLYPHHGVHT